LISEKQLILACQNGDKKASCLLVERYAGVLMTICRRYARDESMAKDLLQESLIKIFSSINSYKPFGSFEGWMKKITVNCSIQWINKSHFKREIYSIEIEEKFEGPPILDALATDDIITKIQQLPEGYRMVLNLYIVEGFSHKEIAEMLDISIGTSRSQLQRARQRLIKNLKEFPNNISV